MKVYIRCYELDRYYCAIDVSSVEVICSPSGKQMHITLCDGVTYVLRHVWSYEIQDNGNTFLLECDPDPDDIFVLDLAYSNFALENMCSFASDLVFGYV